MLRKMWRSLVGKNHTDGNRTTHRSKKRDAADGTDAGDDLGPSDIEISHGTDDDHRCARGMPGGRYPVASLLPFAATSLLFFLCWNRKTGRHDRLVVRRSVSVMPL
jgi:hypothetical protein